MLERRCLVQVCPNSARAATEALGALLAEHAQAEVEHAQHAHQAPAASAPAQPQRSISMDGVLAHSHDAGWKELKVGCVYTTRPRRPRPRPAQIALHTEAQRYVSARAEADRFGWQLWAEACRRGVSAATELVVIGDGAHGIWNLASEHVPTATQIVDWYHASQSVWTAASTLYGEGSALRTRWAQHQLDALWEGRVADVLAALEPYRAKGEGVTDALSYYTIHCSRMNYPSYRTRGLQIGSGTIERACKQLVGARLKLAGMIWDADGAEAVAVTVQPFGATQPLTRDLAAVYQQLQQVPDQRKRRGVRYPLAVLLTIALLAKPAGATQLRAIAE